MDKVSTITTLTTRRPKWQYPPAQPTPRILHLPRRPRRKPQVPKANATKPSSQRDEKGKLEALFDQGRGVVPIMMASGSRGYQCFQEERRERVEERESVVMEEEKWRFQAEMLRAECNLLRMEREIAVKKMERRRVQMERILRSAVETLLSGRKGICDGKDASMVLDEEIQKLVEKLEKLQRRSGVKDLEGRKCSNLDRHVSLLQRGLKNFGGESDEICVKEIQEVAEASMSIKTNCSVHETCASNRSCNMEILRRTMEGLSNRSLLERMEDEHGSMHFTASSTAANYASTSKRIIEFPDKPSSSTRQPCKEKKTCSGCCKIIVRSVIEQVQAETEQWSQMQEVLGQVRNEMEELQASRDFWEVRALDSDRQIQSLNSAVQEWRQKALSSEAKANELQSQVAVLQVELERLRKERVEETSRSKNLPSVSLEAPNETQKRVLVCRLKENRNTNDDCRQKKAFSDGSRKPHARAGGLNAPKRSLLRDIGNSSPLARQNRRPVFPLHYPVQENFKF
ncbi:PREDICTED: myosin-8-like isoform X2 [Populus euphratica]|uniref:Myosin-8-like isoform X2 n=1 Tax=Populus euphratica TaxID=75702 RepID=A0AAJ6UAZ9_POPEU|nr:PREDICTED: myosin-8-like isoform X2 [Populus euphratica]XP_011032043.1 PREDICTED: myosin-8-like isoform X2 [Populus euphratica]